MAWDGNGNFQRLFSWVADKANGINPSSSRFDQEDNGFAAAGFGNCITRDGQGKATASQLPSTDASFDLGSNAARWRNGYFSGPVTSNNLAIPRIFVAHKVAFQTVTSSTALVIDNDLQIALPGTGTYAFKLWLSSSSQSPGGFAAAMNYTGTIANGAWGSTVSTSAGAGSARQVIWTGSPVAAQLSSSQLTGDWYNIDGFVQATAAGTLALYWTQHTSNATGTQLDQGCFMTVMQV